MKAILLARVSDEHQDSHQAQISRMQDYMRRFESVDTFELTESSTKPTRKQFEQILERIRKSKETIALVVDTIDRLQRGFRESVMFDELRKQGKVELHFYRENLVISERSNSSDLLRWDMGVMLARSYVLQLSDNVKRKNDYKVKSGEWCGMAPFGYRNSTLPDGKKWVDVDAHRAPFVRKAFELYASGGYSLATLVKHMTDEGMRSTSNKVMGVSQMECIIKNPFYYGEMLIKGVVYPHRYEPIISKQLYQKAQSVRTGYGKKHTQYAALPFVLRGLIRCEACGCMVSPERQGSYVYYSCTNFKKAHAKSVYVREEDLLKPIKEILNSLQLSQDVADYVSAEIRKVNETKVSYHKDALSSLQTEYAKVQSRVDSLMDFLLDKAITKNEYDRKLAELKFSQQKLIAQMDEHRVADESYYVTVARVFDIANRAKDIFENSEVEEKRKILSFLLPNLLLREKELIVELKKPFDSLVDFNKMRAAQETQNRPLEAIQTVWLPMVDEFRTLNWRSIRDELQFSGILHFVPT